MISLPGGVQRWVDFTIPGSSPPVRLARLDADERTRASVSLVRFPPGWSRPEEGHYTCGEEFVVLEGELQVSGVVYRAGDFAWLPAGTLRQSSRTDTGVLAVAWFTGPPAWAAGGGPAPLGSPCHLPLAGVQVPAEGLVLRTGKESRTVLYETAPARLGGPAHVLWPGTKEWGRLEASERLPTRDGRALVRAY